MSPKLVRENTSLLDHIWAQVTDINIVSGMFENIYIFTKQYLQQNTFNINLSKQIALNLKTLKFFQLNQKSFNNREVI